MSCLPSSTPPAPSSTTCCWAGPPAVEGGEAPPLHCGPARAPQPGSAARPPPQGAQEEEALHGEIRSEFIGRIWLKPEHSWGSESRRRGRTRGRRGICRKEEERQSRRGRTTMTTMMRRLFLLLVLIQSAKRWPRWWCSWTP